MLARFWKATWSYIAQIFFPRAVENGPQHPPKATKTAKTLKNFENDSQKPMGYPSRLRFWSQPGCILGPFWRRFSSMSWTSILDHLCSLFFKILEALLDWSGQARWRARRSAALWTRTGPEGAQLRVWVFWWRSVEFRGDLCRSPLHSILLVPSGQAELRDWMVPGPRSLFLCF